MSDPLGPFLETRPEGLYAPAFAAFLDPPAPAPRAILSHAHADHAAAGHGEILATPETIALYRRRNPDWTGTPTPIAYGEHLGESGTTLTLIPSGHVLGAAQVFLEAEAGSLLYTGDFKLARGRTAPPAESRRADVLLTESTFGLPVFHFPERRLLEERLVAACREAIDAGAIPVVLAYALGKSQEAVVILTQAQIPTVLHGAAWKLLPEYEKAGHSFPLSRAYETGPPAAGEVLIAPPNCARTPMIQKIKSRSIIYASGWALRSASRADFDADILLPLSDHADFTELLTHVENVRPKMVVALHGYARDFARILTEKGVPAGVLDHGADRREEDA